MKALILAEKPSVGRDIARVLGVNKKGNGYFENGNYIVTWGLGHLVTLADPEEYSPEYKEWKLEDLPMLPEPMKLVVIRQTGKQFQAVKSLLRREEVSEVIIATDAGREGELVARWILQKAGCTKPLKRLWISSVTDRAIREGFACLKDGRAYENLYAAALSRAEADWLVGINATRALTCRYNAQLSCGRVQTPTISLIAEREAQIQSFRPASYYGLTAHASDPAITFFWRDKESKTTRCFDREKVQTLLKQLEKPPAVIAEVIKTPKRTMPPELYDLNELQRDANRRFGFSAKQTLDLMQRLYENHKVLTYPRTDSRYLPSDLAETLRERLEACCVGPYRTLGAPLRTLKFTKKAPYINDSKVTDHHAIVPTEQPVLLGDMTSEERKIYDLVVRRFLAVLYPPFEYEQTTVRAVIGGEEFFAKGKIVKQAGWKAVYGENDPKAAEPEEEGEEENTELPVLTPKMKLESLRLKLTEGKTKPPSPYTEATLLTAMEQKGLGTVATRADIIEKLFRSFLIEKRERDLFITSKGKQLLSLVPEDLKKPELTADWEKRLIQISEGRAKKSEFLNEIRGYTKELIGQIKTADKAFRHDNLTNKKCPSCGKRLLAVKGKNAELLICQDRECGYRETVARTSNARCPVCHKKMTLKGSGEEQQFICVCGYKEKLSAFRERREKEGANVSKRDVSAYLKRQKEQESEPLNSAMAEALAKLSLNQKN